MPSPFAAAAAEIHGTITAGPRSVPLGSVLVLARADSKELSTRSDANGGYRLAPLEPGISYALTIEAEGLRNFVQRGIVLQEGEERRLDAHLELADVRDSIVVTEGVVRLQSDSSEISHSITPEDFRELPSVTRSPAKFALLDPHVRQAIGLGSDYQDSNRLSINAGSYRHTAYLLDGTTMYDWTYSVAPQQVIAPAAVKEVKVLTGQYAAQYGTSTTGVLVMTTASGTERHHGEAFGFLRPSGLQSTPPVATFRVPNERAVWGASAGGPVGKGRTFYFANHEGARQDRGAYIQSPTPGFFIGWVKEYYGLVRVDHDINASQSLAARLNGNRYESNNANDRVSGFTQPSAGRIARTQALGGQLTLRSVLGSKLNEARLSVVNYVPDSATPLESSVAVVRPNYSTEGYSTSNWVHAQTYGAGDVLAFRRGRHEVKLGGETMSLRAKDYSYTPLGTYTFAPGAPRAGERAVSFSQTFGAVDMRYRETALNVFVQDDIRIVPRLTVSLGLRYEYQTITDDRNNVAPRLGLAWDVAGNGRTVVRAGAGIFYDQYYMYVARRFYTLGPNAPTSAYSLPAADPAFPVFPNSLSAPPAGASSGKQNLYLSPGELLNPYSMQLSLAVERELPGGLILTVSGLHAHTVKQMRVNDINHPVPFLRTAPGQVRSGAAADGSRPYQTYAGIPVRDLALIENTAGSIYECLDLGVERRFGGRVRFSGHYVLSGSATYAMFYADANSGVPDEWWPDMEGRERAPSDFYQRHRFVGHATADLPLRSQVAFIVTAASGLPVNPITGIDNNGDTYVVDRPVGVGRNSFRAPRQLNVDAAVAKRFKLNGRIQAEARIEALNLFNHPNFIRVNSIYGEGPAPLRTFLAPIAGITNSDPSRQFQFMLRLHF
jgi:hypothetical protein